MTYPKILTMTFAVHEAYRRLGIPSENIHVASKAGPDGDRVMVVAKQGTKMFAFDLGKRRLSYEEYERLWTQLVAEINSGAVTEADLQSWFYSWLEIVDGGAFGLVMAMKAKGFAIRDHDTLN